MTGGAVTLGTVARRTATLDVACGSCRRRCRMSVNRLLVAHGPGMPMPSLLRLLANCPRSDAAPSDDQCGAHFPQLAGMFLANR